MRPTLSVLISAHNEAAYLPLQLAHLGPQLTPDDELILVDDGSTDETEEIIEHASGPNGSKWTPASVNILVHDTRMGMAASYNHASILAEKEWLWPVSANDLVLPGAVAAWWEVAACFGHRYPVIFGDVTELGSGLTDGSTRAEPYPMTPEHVRNFLQTRIINGGGVLIRRQEWYDSRGYDQPLSWLADYYLQHKIALTAGAVYLPRVLMGIRRLPNALSEGWRDPSQLAPVLDRLADLLTAAPDLARVWLDTILPDLPEAGSGVIRDRLMSVVGV